jgi:hypothetical protein
MDRTRIARSSGDSALNCVDGVRLAGFQLARFLACRNKRLVVACFGRPWLRITPCSGCSAFSTTARHIFRKFALQRGCL